MSTGNISARVRVDGKFFRLGEQKFYPKGVTYGPFAPNADGDRFAAREQTLKDFLQIRELGANLLRVYHVPPRWFLDLAAAHELKVMIDIPWNKHLCFLDSAKSRAEARVAVHEAVQGCGGHPAVFAFSVVNEIAADLVRWSGAHAVGEFIEDLVNEAKDADPGCLCTFGNYPPTEFLRVLNIDFLCFNVYLHERRTFENYLARLQMIADAKPLLLGETGIDSQREGEAQKCEMLAWQIEAGFQGGLAGLVVFSYTDDWFRNGMQIDNWFFGLTTRERQPRESFHVVQKQFRQAPYFPLPSWPKVSVVVASYNGARTLDACLKSLARLNYLNYEVILVDDGSTDETARLVANYKNVRYLRQENKGLSVARNAGSAAATGEIVAFTDSDCRADEDWLHYLIGDLLSSKFTGIGGHNFLPPEDSWIAAAVLVSPGGPAHVMLTDRLAEHIPGCNMAFYKWALDSIGGFDPIYRKAGDDVDVCWRLQQRGCKIGFSPSGFVWHYRRATVPAYLKQQAGYGEAEALLAVKHAEYFNSAGGGIWRGRIYTASKMGVIVKPPVIYHGLFGGAWFQTLYAGEPALAFMLCTSLEFHVLVTLPLLVLAVPFRAVWPLGVATLLASIIICLAAAAQADLPKTKRRFWSRPLVALLFFLQPIARGWARYHGRLALRTTPEKAHLRLDAVRNPDRNEPLDKVRYWSGPEIERLAFVHSILAALDKEGWQHRADEGWSGHDVEIYGTRWSRLQLITVAEEMERAQKLFHCRLDAGWSLLAKLCFWSLLGFELLVIGFGGEVVPYLWLLLLTMPIFGSFIEQEKRNLQRLIIAFLDELARQQQMTKLPFGRPAEPAAQAAPGAVPSAKR